MFAALLDRFRAVIGGAADGHGAGPDRFSQWTAAEQDGGPPLGSVVEVLGPLPPDAVAALAVGIVAELANIHAFGDVHRQLTPSNVLLPETGPRLVHSGITRTVTGATLTDLDGTPLTLAYLTPEQILGQQLGPETDVFALGGVLAFAASGVSPFGSDEPLSVLYRIANEEPTLDTVPGSIRGLIKACLNKDRTQRPTLQMLNDRAIGVLTDARLTHERATGAETAREWTADIDFPQNPVRQQAEPHTGAALLGSIPAPTRRRRARSRSANVAVLGTVVVGIAAAFMVREVIQSSAPPPAPVATPSALSTVTATTAATATATAGLSSAPLPGTFLTGPGCPASPWAGITESVTAAGGLSANVGGGLAECGGTALAFLKTGATTPGPSSVAWTFRLGRSAHCTLSVYVAATDASSGYAHYRLAVPASNAATVLFQINQSTAKGRWVAAPELAGLSLPDGSVRLVLTDAAAYPGDRFHVTASAVQASCSPLA